MELKKTCLHLKHLELKARMAEFAGYDMPISYDAKTGGMLKEHLAVRQHMGMFDVSHMGEFWVTGPDASPFLSYATTRPTENLADGRAQYCMLLTEQGTIVDDIIIYKYSPTQYWVVVNASNIEKDFRHLSRLASQFKVELKNVSSETALIAIQGPKAADLIKKLIPETAPLKYYSFLETPQKWIVARTGYTGEDGFEVFLPPHDALELWNTFEKNDVVPIGLGARDTLRLEVGFSLYGHELSENLHPNETFSAFAADQHTPHFGATASRVPPRHLAVAIETKTPKPIRAEEALFLEGKRLGWVTSGSISPLKKVGIGLALIDIKALNQPLAKDAIFMLESGGKQREAVRTELPFVSTPRVKKRGI